MITPIANNILLRRTRILLVAIAVLVLAGPPALFAQSGAYVQVTSQNIGDFKNGQYPLFEIENGMPNLPMGTDFHDAKPFRIIVTPPDNRPPDGLLSIVKDGKQIAICLVAGTQLLSWETEAKETGKTVLGKSLVLGFAVSPDYLSESKFTIFIPNNAQPGGLPGFIGYWFYLKDFTLTK